jgi:2-iminobutanoate/2-iminopropanoate deaminase
MRTLLVLAALAVSLAPAAEKKAVVPEGTPPGRPFSPGILVGDTLYVSGNTGTDPKTGKLPAEFEAEVRQTLENIGTVLKKAKMDYANVVSVQVFLTDMDLFQRMNAVYMTYFKEPRPVRTTVGISRLAGGAHVEINAIAHK